MTILNHEKGTMSIGNGENLHKTIMSCPMWSYL